MANDKDSSAFSQKDTGGVEEKASKESADFVVEEREQAAAETQAPVEREVEKQDNSKLREEIENMDVDDSLKSQVQSDAANIALLEEGKKIKNLLALAKSKGVVYAVKIAQNMNDPYLLDKFHDLLIEKGYYKEFTK
ncbi:hypothetical protein KW786_01960 [Candidatus Parcubacteria bacterium]|nr:hypothetical protein [Candidatus Parcubacteria bacterium]